MSARKTFCHFCEHLGRKKCIFTVDIGPLGSNIAAQKTLLEFSGPFVNIYNRNDLKNRSFYGPYRRVIGSQEPIIRRHHSRLKKLY